LTKFTIYDMYFYSKIQLSGLRLIRQSKPWRG